MKLESILKAIKNTKKYYPGTSAVYFQIRKGFGAKFYTSEHERNFAYEKQNIFNKLTLAPKVGRKIDLPSGLPDFKNMKYGFITQSAPAVVELINSCKMDLRTFGCIAELMQQKTKSLGYQLIDDHTGNIGKLRNRYVFIDFDYHASGAKKILD